jgi:hypothetical protein
MYYLPNMAIKIKIVTIKALDLPYQNLFPCTEHSLYPTRYLGSHINRDFDKTFYIEWFNCENFNFNCHVG